MRINIFFWGCMLMCVCGLAVVSNHVRFLFAQQPKIIQTDYKDIGSRQKADRDIWVELRRINRQTQTDTLVFTDGNTADTVYLDNKYGDTAYTIFLLYRKESGTQHTDMPYVCPLSDSSFVISSIHIDDVSVVQWMTISK